MAKAKMTSIQVKPETRDRLAEIGKKRETFDEIIDRLLKTAEKGNAEGFPSAV